MKDEGVTGVEMIAPIFKLPGMKSALDNAGLDLVGQIHTSSEVESLETFKYKTTANL